jgi:hypothetical protein
MGWVKGAKGREGIVTSWCWRTEGKNQVLDSHKPILHVGDTEEEGRSAAL